MQSFVVSRRLCRGHDVNAKALSSRFTSIEPQAIDSILFCLCFVFKVKVLYARNLLLSTTEDTIEQVFSKFGEVERVKKIKDYSFIHFRTKEQARAALEAMNGNKTFMLMFCGSITF